MKRTAERMALVVLLSVLPSAARAQCPSSSQVSYLGITQLECDCVIAPVTRNTQWRFESEPRIVRIERGSAADGRLQPGDVIVSVNGRGITTTAGASALARPPRNQNIVIGVRRDGRVQYHTLRGTSVCPTDARLLGATAPVALRSSSAGAYEVRPTPTPAPAAPVSAPAVWIGLAFSCDDCSYQQRSQGGVWSFRTPPQVYSVEPGSPAYAAGMRRGDVLTHINEVSITSAEGGRRWAALKAGDRVRIRYRRGGSVRTATVEAAAPRVSSYAAAAAPAQVARQWQEVQEALVRRDSTVLRLVQQYEQTVTSQQAEQEVLLRQLRDRAQTPAERERLDAVLRTYTQQQAQLRRRQEQALEELVRERQAELARTDAARQSLERLVQSTVTPTVAPVAVTAGAQRYSGTFGGVEIEVRGGNPVIVSEDGNELVIRMADGSTVRLRRPR